MHWLVIARLKCCWNVITGLSENVLYTLKFYISHILLPSLTSVVLFIKIEITPWDSIKDADLTNDFSLGCLWISFFSQISSCFLSYCPLEVEYYGGRENPNHPLFSLRLLLNFHFLKLVKYLIGIMQLVWPLPFITFVSLLPCAPLIALCFLVVVSNMAWGHCCC